MPPPPADNASAGLCSQLSAERGLPLVGSAGCYDSILAFELDAPWTPRLVGSRASDALLDAAIERIGANAHGVRLLAVEPRERLAGSMRRETVHVLRFVREPGPFAAYRRREYRVRRDDLAHTLERLASSDASQVPDVEGELACDPGLRDVLVCTHGARDACCGKFGFRLFLEVAASAERGGPGSTAVRAWRCSHLGGHRFAPTMLDLPSGRMFGRMADGDAAVVLGGGGALVDRLAFIYRGRCALPEPAQIVESELWSRTGAAFESAALSWQVGGDADTDHWSVRMDAELAGSAPSSIAVQVIRAIIDAVETPASCGRDPEVESPWRILG